MPPKDKDYQVLSLDLQKCRTEDLRSDAVWIALIWGARQGRIAHVVGAPPRSAVLQHIASGHKWNELRYGAERDLATRMLILHCVATAGRLANPDSRHVAKEVGLLIEYPDFVQIPESLRAKIGSGFWDSDQWKAYQTEAGLSKVVMSTAAGDDESCHRWTVGTNYGVLVEVARDQSEQPTIKASHSAHWTPAFRFLLREAMAQHPRYIRVSTLTPKQWRQHLQSGHQPYYRGCKACFLGNATGHQHRKIQHPSIDTLSIDVAGPIRVRGVDPDGRGRAPQTFKYLLVGVYRYPKLTGVKAQSSA